jgi:hypothetical protein
MVTTCPLCLDDPVYRTALSKRVHFGVNLLSIVTNVCLILIHLTDRAVYVLGSQPRSPPPHVWSIHKSLRVAGDRLCTHFRCPTVIASPRFKSARETLAKKTVMVGMWLNASGGDSLKACVLFNTATLTAAVFYL